MRSAKVSLPSGRLNRRSLNLLFPIEVSGNSRIDDNLETYSTEKKDSTRQFVRTAAKMQS